MYGPFRLGLKYLKYYCTASNSKGHGMHSPFVFSFIKNVLNDTTVYPAYQNVEQLRQKLVKDETLVTLQDFGAGSSVDKTNQRTIASIARNAAKPSKYAQLLYRMVQFYQPSSIIELGTSLGITTSYLSLAKPGARLFTLEGADTIAEKARQHFQALQLSNISQINGNFDDTLSSAIAQVSPVDLVFIDGNHRCEPTERYFTQLLPATHNDSILIFDDIHWSAGMEQAWQAIQQHPSVRATIDLFFIGIVLFRQEFREKQHFTIRF